MGLFLIRLPDGGLDDGALRLVQAAADARAKVDRVGRGGSEPGLIVPIRRLEIEHVERMARAERELDVDPAQLFGQASVLVLGIDDVDLDASAQRGHRQG